MSRVTQSMRGECCEDEDQRDCLYRQLSKVGVEINPKKTRVWWNLGFDEVRAMELQLEEGELTPTGALAFRTGIYTGRSPNDRYIVERAPSAAQIAWGDVNRPISPETFEKLRHVIGMAAAEAANIFVFDGYAGARKDVSIRVRVIAERAIQHHFARNMFLSPECVGESLGSPSEWRPQLTIISFDSAHAQYQKLGLNSEAFIVFDMEQGLGLVGSTRYCGEIKKGVFSVANYLYPPMGILPMHCSATKGKDHPNDTVLFFGLSGTGKTTLSADPTRLLIGDDETAWDNSGVFNIEGGCYAKVIDLREESEPDIFRAIRTDALLENAVLDETGRPDLSDGSITQNIRCSYPLAHIPSHEPTKTGDHPHAIVFLACDVYGVLPPVAKLSESQAIFHFLCGYSSKMTGTERGVNEPTPTFSPCFGGAFMPRSPFVYAKLLRDKIREHSCAVYLVNTGWTGGSYGQGSRMSISVSRAIVRAIVTGELRRCQYRDPDDIFLLATPTHVGGVSHHILTPRNTWNCEWLYEATALKLRDQFLNHWSWLAESSPQDMEELGLGRVIRGD
uniref:phosphoenolpyruvate carboxykinase (ATP) n=1 Tax=Compsopogon caeruleus TaxID=31354 RepID=A0A7S1XB83_9RHOD|mmetsp:Transcript_11450/g.23236  ORF Transcript_11450/g.23236 Transcript_11450/m.23236 type:complete len:562 (+) Transcript_11450:120-1805(+)|eukprot:CAMPEP_0184684308 /NCGR_PEP_ID=MMETSP0312-20130426/14808_1 /TAXON_ID=31354 /ORGANISM="Compsopogon coeruleus, Strain SAG 36.94" /LENGTH=561 /DNA_ID=CAMNT_0027137381 /DNA_START=58 /DNA_END=1743 /DNA_ORIENTATION=-